MKKIYQSPNVYAYKIVGKRFLLNTSIKVDGTDKVSNSSDIGFVKEQSSQSGDNSVWDDEW